MNDCAHPWSVPEVPDLEHLNPPELAQHLRLCLDAKTKPLGSLGRIETLAQWLGLIQGRLDPRLEQAQLLLFAADHGLAAQGVSAYPSAVTAQMVRNFLAGGAAVSVLARQHALALTVVDVGVASPLPPQPGLQVRKVALGSADASREPAMTPEQCAAALAHGADAVRALPGNALLLGEMGIGNTSAAALLLARLGGLALDDCVGAGTGLDAAGVAHKRAVLQRVLHLHAHAQTPLEALAALGGLEIAALVGAALQAAAQRRVIVVDGFIVSAAVLVAARLRPALLQRCVFAHRSDERGHAALLRLLKAEPLLDLGLRLGEGSGAALAWPLLVSACALLNNMASFASAGVSGASAA
ncbi:MAG: nicotinate-nucleotide--dimethylbenzimidazole phosphoribosyltransferase [Pseudomonadota bacterium]|jgi:nicotinate-nucleotide--dimethylbenzimidazole phosphoribosyltransferase